MSIDHQPRARRPSLQAEYGMPTSSEGLVDWAAVEERLRTALHYWVSTVSPRGAPQSSPVWGLWADGAFYFSCGTESWKARNMAIHPEVEVHLESGTEVVIVRGKVEPAVASREMIAAYNAKYGEGSLPDDPAEIGGGFSVVRPSYALAWTSFPTDVTRFDFS